MAITAAQVKELRDKTGAGMMDAKKALTETDGDMAAAMDLLRVRGLAQAEKKAGRTAAEGVVAVAVRDGVGVLVEVNSETDFVARNPEFQEMARAIAEAALDVQDIEALRSAKIGDSTVADTITDKIATIGENLSVRRMARIEGERVAAYVHNQVADGMGKIGVLVSLSGGDAESEIGRQVAMHVAAIAPVALDVEDLDPALVEHEKAVLTEQAKESGRPEHVIEKMITGRLNKFYEEVCLLKQSFVVNPDVSVGEAVKQEGGDLKVTGFVRFIVGEGVEKAEEDFAAEVASMTR
ncbi:MAG TPA: translation elongation factor Ts [Paracoccaceae bacterium]|nr:translation elongation factor Ts [Paracoccaceae bacterium]